MNQAVTDGRVCQSCGMPMLATEHFGTNSNNSPHSDYCCFCFQNGSFTHNMSMEQTIAESIGYLDGSEKVDGYTLTKDEAALKMRVQLPTLKRWTAHQTTHQEYFKAVNRAVGFINEHLAEPFNLHDLADVANISGFHFHRIFKALLGETPGDYVQRLRLEKAIFKLQTTQLPLTRIAEKTGYQSIHALSKAFKKRFGISPSYFRSQPSDLNVAIPPQEGLVSATPEMRNIAGKEVVCIRVADPFGNPDAFTHAWRKLTRFMHVDGIPDETHEYLSLSHDVSTITKPEHYRMYACITSLHKINPSGEFNVQTIQGGLYAVFIHQGPYKTLESLYCHIYRNWVPNSDFELRDIAFFEKYLNSPDVVDKKDLLTEVYIPVKPIG